MKRQSFYSEQITLHQTTLRRIRKRRNLVTLLKLLVFTSFIAEISWLITHGSLNALFPLLSAIAFILLSRIDSRIVQRQKTTEKLILLNEQEIAALQGDFSAFPTGASFNNPIHAYSADLDLFGENSLYQQLNRTATTAGSLRLAQWMQYPCLEKDTLLERQQAVSELADLPEWCLRFRTGTIDNNLTSDYNLRKVWRYASPKLLRKRISRIALYTSNILTIACWLIVICGWLPASFALTLSAIQLLIIASCVRTINNFQRRIDRLIHHLSRELPTVSLIKEQTFQSAKLQKIRNELLHPDRNALQAFTELHKLQERIDQRGNVLLTIILDGLYMKDLHTLFHLERWVQKYERYIDHWDEQISETDALVSLATFCFNHPAYTFPAIDESVILDARDAGHPLIHGRTCVTNDFHIGEDRRIYIITGANMAGKSTFLRTIGINLVLAQMGSVVCSSRFVFRPTSLFTSMRTTDNLAQETSYFHAELIRLRQLVCTANEGPDLFIILDEMLKGTNSIDKLNGSLAFLLRISKLPVSGLVATHDLALSQLHERFPERFENACFEITHRNTQINYDYKLRPGVSNTMNATLLMQQMGLI